YVSDIPPPLRWSPLRSGCSYRILSDHPQYRCEKPTTEYLCFGSRNNAIPTCYAHPHAFCAQSALQRWHQYATHAFYPEPRPLTYGTAPRCHSFAITPVGEYKGGLVTDGGFNCLYDYLFCSLLLFFHA